MEKKRRNRYLVAVYSIIGLLAVILILIGKFTTDTFFQAIWVNLATGLLGVALLFFLVDCYFLADELRLSDRIEQLVQKLEPPSAEDFFKDPPVLNEFIEQADKIDLCGVTLTGTINRQFGRLRERILDGASVRLLIIEPGSLALDMTASRSENTESVSYYSQRLELTIKDIRYLMSVLEENKRISPQNNTMGSLEIRFIPYAPSFRIDRFRGMKDEVLFVEIYPHQMGQFNPPIFSLTPDKDGEWYVYFSKQFDNMWEKATVWDIFDTSRDDLYFGVAESKYRSRVPVTTIIHKKRFLPQHLTANANTVFISGYALTKTVKTHINWLRKMLEKGAHVKIVILEPQKRLLKECAIRSTGKSKPEYWQNQIQLTVSQLKILASDIPPSSQSVLEIGYLPYLPSFGLFALDLDTGDGMISVEIYQHKSDEENPTFEVYASKDEEWYRFFRNQCKQIWNSCRLEKLTKDS